ncbi:MAG: hypothetical protein LBP98_09520, partial [Tannerella sp.]|nr:hypothetical protein [Tannerella sp.]
EVIEGCNPDGMQRRTIGGSTGRGIPPGCHVAGAFLRVCLCGERSNPGACTDAERSTLPTPEQGHCARRRSASALSFLNSLRTEKWNVCLHPAAVCRLFVHTLS